MNEVKKIQIAKYICHSTRLFLLLFTIFWMLFALLSGAEIIGGGIRGVIYNVPNALPWFILLIFVLLTFRWEFIGGMVIILMGFFTLFFFNASENHFILWMISIPIIIFGIIFLISWYLSRIKLNH
jgi:hypothetical protein